jgi:hypothetical protein
MREVFLDVEYEKYGLLECEVKVKISQSRPLTYMGEEMYIFLLVINLGTNGTFNSKLWLLNHREITLVAVK